MKSNTAASGAPRSQLDLEELDIDADHFAA